MLGRRGGISYIEFSAIADLDSAVRLRCARRHSSEKGERAAKARESDARGQSPDETSLR